MSINVYNFFSYIGDYFYITDFPKLIFWVKEYKFD